MQRRKEVVIIVGASGSLGSALALAAVRYNVNIVLMSRRAEAVSELRKAVVGAGNECLVVPVDISDPESVLKAFRSVDDTWPDHDILFNCAGVVHPFGPIIHTTSDSLLTALRTNVFGVYLVTREAIKRMLKQERGGTIINITSGAARNPYLNWSAYCSHKAAVDMFTKCVGLEVRDQPVRVIAISPGPFDGRMQQIIRNSSPEEFPERGKFIKLYERGELEKPSSVARRLLNIALSNWPELSGKVVDLRSPDFIKKCGLRGIVL